MFEKINCSAVKGKVSLRCLERYPLRWRTAGKRFVILMITVLVNFVEKAV